MSLLRAIQSAAVDPNTDVSTLLRKCKILAARLGNDEFKKWVDNELNGYERVEDLPEYRILRVDSFGHFTGPLQSGLKNAPIPPMCLPEKLRDWMTTAYLVHPISAYAALLADKSSNNPQEFWPADIVALYGRQIYQYMNCLSAWKLLPRNSVVALIDTVKTRVLSFALEIEEEAPDAGEAPPNERPLSQEKVSQVFNTYISGNVQNVATGSTHVTQTGEFTVNTGDLPSLEKYLASLGIEEQDIAELLDFVKADAGDEGERTLGQRVQGWMGTMVGKAASGAWNVSTSVAGTVLAKALSRYYGLE